MKMKECGICGAKDEVMNGPYCGGPFVWYCVKCRRIINIYLEGLEAHRAWFKRVVEQAKIERGMRSLFA